MKAFQGGKGPDYYFSSGMTTARFAAYDEGASIPEFREESP
jgi:hypothetical protein